MYTTPAILAEIFGIGAPELLVVLVILLVLFGGAKLPSLAKGLGQSIKEFKKASRDDGTDEAKPAAAQPAAPAKAAVTEETKAHGPN